MFDGKIEMCNWSECMNSHFTTAAKKHTVCPMKMPQGKLLRQGLDSTSVHDIFGSTVIISIDVIRVVILVNF